MTTPDGMLTLGALDLIDNEDSGFKAETFAEDSDLGNAVPIEKIVRSGLLDGSFVVHEGDDNREIPLRVKITAPDAGGHRAGAAALRAELYRRNQLTYTPPKAYGEQVVYEVITSSMSRVYDDLVEIQAGERHYAVRLVCEPFGHDPEPTEVTPTGVDIGTDRCLMHTVTVTGSARTRPALALQHPTDSAGRALIYSFPDDGRGYSPPLRQYASAATVSAATADSARVSGFRNTIETARRFDVPGDTLYEGSHQIVGLIQSSAFATVTLSVQVFGYVDGALVATEDKLYSTQTFSVPDLAYRWAIFGMTNLPVVDVYDPAESVIRLDFKHEADGSGATISLDDAFLLNTSTGAITQVDMAVRNLFIEPPSVANPRPRLLQGQNLDKSDAYNYGPSVHAADPHVFYPGDNGILTVSPTAEGPTLTARWHENHPD